MATAKITIAATLLLLILRFESIQSISKMAEAVETPGPFVSLSDSRTGLDKQAAADLTIFWSRFVRINWAMVFCRRTTDV
jgi:hypothetical protein